MRQKIKNIAITFGILCQFGVSMFLFISFKMEQKNSSKLEKDLIFKNRIIETKDFQINSYKDSLIKAKSYNITINNFNAKKIKK